MYTKADLKTHLSGMGIRPQGSLLIHSSMKAIGDVENGADTVLDAFIEYMKDGLLIFPTHTWHEDNNPGGVYNPFTEPSCVGILGNLFMKRAGVIRSWHPSHSVAALGKDADTYTSGEELRNTPCSREGCWGKLYDRKAQILFLGCTLKSNTFIHGVEEWNDVPERLTEEYHHYKIVNEKGQQLDYAQKCHSKKYGDVSRNYDKLLAPGLHEGIVTIGKIGDATSYLCEAKALADMCSEFLRKDPQLFLDDSPVPEKWYK
ncbi:AAC(3) family N-acetyltransferase [Porifericola rhodea]|uniref:AAC(3) family N-acetyltransferase n=1 Tax=Porifericola rhodea TaxID=930972 RepID=UPI0026656410|nr:AAC(3) family N-acetyltransferase [Porifericola rhodea]WKN29644.1 AAC(3) family N-acetyltransferase [Porifericola rhodea]